MMVSVGTRNIKRKFTKTDKWAYMKRIRTILLCLTCVGLTQLEGIAQETFQIRRINNSKTYSQIEAINSKLEVIGMKEVSENDISSTKSFFRRGEEEIEIPVLKDFTNVQAEALSENGLVVGYASRAIGAVGGGTRAFVWDSHSKELKPLPPLPSDLACHAQDISADGKKISGYSVGNSPARMRPCLWEWQEKSKEWTSQELESILPNNPFLQAGHVIISPDGKRIAATISVKQLADFIFVNALHVWEKNEAGKWDRKKVSDEEPKLKDINNAGTIVGCLKVEGVTRACVFDLSGKCKLIDLLEGDASSIAYAVNNAGIVVGLSDDPPGETGEPKAFVYQDGVVTPLELSGRGTSSAALAINQEGVIAGFFLDGLDEKAAISGFIRIPGKK